MAGFLAGFRRHRFGGGGNGAALQGHQAGDDGGGFRAGHGVRAAEVAVVVAAEQVVAVGPQDCILIFGGHGAEVGDLVGGRRRAGGTDDVLAHIGEDHRHVIAGDPLGGIVQRHVGAFQNAPVLGSFHILIIPGAPGGLAGHSIVVAGPGDHGQELRCVQRPVGRKHIVARAIDDPGVGDFHHIFVCPVAARQIAEILARQSGDRQAAGKHGSSQARCKNLLHKTIHPFIIFDLFVQNRCL